MKLSDHGIVSSSFPALNPLVPVGLLYSPSGFELVSMEVDLLQSETLENSFLDSKSPTCVWCSIGDDSDLDKASKIACDMKGVLCSMHHCNRRYYSQIMSLLCIWEPSQ